MDTAFDRAFREVIGVEGGYSNHAADRGGETMYGITIAVARKHGYTGPMSMLSLPRAKEIYKLDYWDILNLDKIASIFEPLALEMFEASVNCGPSRVLGWANTAMSVLSNTSLAQSDFSVWLSANVKDAEIAMKLMNIQQGNHYLSLCLNNPSQKAFIRGWINNRVRV